MKIDCIITKRKFECWSSWDLVYEWEDELASFLNIPFYYERGDYKGKRYLKKIVKRIPVLKFLIQSVRKSFIFEMSDWRENEFNNYNNIFPCIIDCYLDEGSLSRFVRQYSNNKVVFLTSYQAYCFLKDKQLPFQVYHLPLSLPSKYAITAEVKYEKKYDLAVVGRPNPVLMSFLKKYVELHPEFIYVYHKNEANKHVYYSSLGNCIGEISTRQQYFDLLKSARMGLYSTSGTDNDKLTYEKAPINTRGMNQVTPRFLEMLSCGCHIIPRYIKNDDTDFYEFDRYWPNIETYEQFENAIDKAMMKEPDMKFYSEYLAKHYTSVRAKLLLKFLKTI